jgi:hypothetical protein
VDTPQHSPTRCRSSCSHMPSLTRTHRWPWPRAMCGSKRCALPIRIGRRCWTD